jgi:hypothetical protein
VALVDADGHNHARLFARVTDDVRGRGAAPARIILRRIDGRSCAICCAIIPPSENPRTSHVVTPRASRKAIACVAISRTVPGTLPLGPGIASRCLRLRGAALRFYLDANEGDSCFCSIVVLPTIYLLAALALRAVFVIGADQPNVKSNAPTPGSRNSISNCRSAIRFACRIN